MSALRELCLGDPGNAAKVLGISVGQREWIEANAELADAPTAAAHEVYTGVLYQSLNYPGLPRAAAARADEQVWVCSALYGVVRLGEPIAAYRLTGGTTLPGLPRPSELWQAPITEVIADADPDLVLDLRSGAYTSLWQPPEAWQPKVVTGKVWQLDRNGRRTSLSHHNKATKGLLTAALMRQSREISTPRALLGAAQRTGEGHSWRAELRGRQLDIVLLPPRG